ncbi:MAG: UDP-N-acetylmuramoyl-L-alanine--D-glutamate ligase [Microgenomates group bacterium]|nr:UDP-N-acetylmuramoyl-L-alanine--D-glutamate ligase [Microgenomates group bacterium]
MADKINHLKKIEEKYKNKKILIVGLGLQGGGSGLAKFFCQVGAKVKVTDLKKKKELKSSLEILKKYPIDYVLGEHRLSDFLEADVIFKGPSVPWDIPQLKAAEKKGIPIEMEISFFAANCPAKIIGITGTRGKSTTTNLIFNLLKRNHLNVHLGGSLPEISTVNLLKKIKSEDLVVLELPSWPLSGFHRKKISPHIGVFTNFYPDHLNYYPNMDEYLYDKKAIYLYQKQNNYLIANQSLQSLIEVDKVKSKKIYYSKLDFPGKLKFLKGEHNQENAAAAFKVAQILNLDQKKTLEAINNFRGLPFRQEIVKIKNRVIFINDTTSTTPIATIKAIDTFDDKPIILLLGGKSKNLPYLDLIDKLAKVKEIILLKGSFTDEIFEILKIKYPEKISPIYDDLTQAVKKAYLLAKKTMQSCYLLFSPGATSFSMFNNEFHRGKEFNQIVEKL